MVGFVSKSKIRSQFLKSLSLMYSREIPEYREFVEIVHKSNHEFIEKNSEGHFDSWSRVTEERHGAIRVGKKEEMKTMTRIFACLGMEPVNFYDLTKVKKPLPVISTAFRPEKKNELEESAFRMFVSMLYLEDERFFNVEERKLIQKTLAKRNVFSAELLDLLDRAEKEGGLKEEHAESLIKEASASLKMDSKQIISFPLYKKFITTGNEVVADIVCFNTIHINHLTPRVYDIFDVHKKLQGLNIPTIDEVQGPPQRENEKALPLLNQTSRKAPGEYVFTTRAEEVLNEFYEKDLEFSEKKILKVAPKSEEKIADYLSRVEKILENGNSKIVAIKHKARFGEIECRGVALTPKGRAVYDKMIEEGNYVSDFPPTHLELAQAGLAYYEYKKTSQFDELDESQIYQDNLFELVEKGYLEMIPVTYEDFLPKSAAGIFESNLSDETKELKEVNLQVSNHQEVIENAMGKKIVDGYQLYSKIEKISLKNIFN